MSGIDLALRILSIWLKSSEDAAAMNSYLSRKYSIRWLAIGLINHDRVLAGRTDLLTLHSFSGAPK